MNKMIYVISVNGLVIQLSEVQKLSLNQFQDEEGLAAELRFDTSTYSTDDLIFMKTKNDGIQVIDLSVDQNRNSLVPSGEYITTSLAIRMFITSWLELAEE